MKKTRIYNLGIAVATIASTVLATAPTAYAALLYEVIDLGTLGGRESSAYGINDLGQVVGKSFTASGQSHAFLWDSTMQDLDSETDFNVHAYKINNLGQVVGIAVQGSQRKGFLWDNSDGMTYWQADGVVDINDSGQMVGSVSRHRASMWNNPSQVQDLGTLGFGPAAANRINNLGQVVGWSTSNQKGSFGDHAFLWDSAKGMTDLGTMGSSYSWAYGINDLGLVVGSASISGGWGGTKRAFLWDSINGMQNLGTIDGKNSYAKDINNANQVVGFAGRGWSSEIAFLWDGTQGIQDLNDLIDPDSGWLLTRAEDINENGWIVGTGLLNGSKRAFLAKPVSDSEKVPEPSAVLGLLALGVLGICRRLGSGCDRPMGKPGPESKWA